MQEPYRYFLRMKGGGQPAGWIVSLGGESLERVAASSDLRLNVAEANSPVVFVGTVKSDR